MTMPMAKALAGAASAVLCLLSGCGEDSGAKFPGPNENVPPIVAAEMDAWVDDRSYLDWTCEPAPRPPREGSPHGEARICQNDLLVEAALDDLLPLGAASVKEQGTGGDIEILNVVVRGTTGEDGDAWFWWRRSELLGNVLVSDFGVAECVDCHIAAPQDLVFTRLDGAP